MEKKLNLTDPIVRNEIAKKYVPLLYKIVNQQSHKCPPETDYEDLVGYGQEGMVYAMNTYKEGTSQSFQQYLGYCILHKIQTGINQEGHTIKFSAYHQRKAKAGEVDYVSTTPFSALSRSSSGDEEEDSTDRIEELGIVDDYEKPVEIWEQICEWARKNFSARDADMFIRFYGLDGQESLEGKELAKKYGVSSCCVTVSKKKIIEALKKTEFMESLIEFIK